MNICVRTFRIWHKYKFWNLCLVRNLVSDYESNLRSRVQIARILYYLIKTIQCWARTIRTAAVGLKPITDDKLLVSVRHKPQSKILSAWIKRGMRRIQVWRLRWPQRNFALHTIIVDLDEALMSHRYQSKSVEIRGLQKSCSYSFGHVHIRSYHRKCAMKEVISFVVHFLGWPLNFAKNTKINFRNYVTSFC